jgi:CMP-N-acetylneuraminic acid synthetase
LVIENKLVDVLITARGGSKRLPNKNKKNLCGKPLIVWTIEAAKKSNFVRDIFVSTDSQEIAQISKINGAIVPRLRSKLLAEDSTSSFDTAMDFIEYFSKDDSGEMLLLQPTSPLRNSLHIDELMLQVRKQNSKQCVAVRDITKLFSLTKSEPKNNKKIYIPNGSIYYTQINYLKKVKTFFSKGCDIYLMNDFCSIDIDTQDEWNIAEACLSKVIYPKK